MSYESGTIVAVFDFRYTTKLTSLLSILRTIFVCIIFLIGSIFFSKDAKKLVIIPITNMINKVNKIAKDPLQAAQEEENEALKQEKENQKQRKKYRGKKKRKQKKEKEIYETIILEQTIIKIGALLALGFGEAGSKVIADNMEQGGDVDPMIPGTKIMAVFGFCDIRRFSEVTEVLQEDVMVFVNQIADIVHTYVDQYSGATNKNIGEAFLLVWKFHDDDVEFDEEIDQLKVKRNNRVSAIADMSTMSFIKIIGAVRKENKYM